MKSKISTRQANADAAQGTTAFITRLEMTKTYIQVLKQIDELKQQAESLRRKEVDGVIVRIREAISHYGLTAADLGLRGGAGASTAASPSPLAEPKKRGRKPGRPKKVTSSKSAVAPKFRDENGNTWAGRGKRPIWLRDALLGGRKLDDFLINK
jgi:DNA-binding protein H-NS